MPRIICPNCGKTINLENRREVDFQLIKKATYKRPCTFTELLHITKLPRKTLSLRIKQLCDMGALIKRNRLYCANGMHGIKNAGFTRCSRFFDDTKIKTCGMLLIFILLFSVSGYVLALMTTGPEKLENLKPTILGNFTVLLNVNEVTDLWAWQVVIKFDSSELTVLSVSSGEFFKVGEEFPDILWDAYSDRLLIGNTMYPGETAKSGSGTLAIIVFGYFVEDYRPPEIVSRSFDAFETYLIDSKGSRIIVDSDTDPFVLIPGQ